MVFRFSLLISLIFVGYAFILFHLYGIQIIHGGDYSARAGSKYLTSSFLKANRGSVYFTDKDGNSLPAIINKEFPIIYAVPKLVADPSEAANALSVILNRPVRDLEKTLGKANDSYEPLAKKADQDLADKISALGIKGIYVDDEPGRFYPLGKLASQVFGFVGPADNGAGEIGRYGIESFYENILVGREGRIIDSKIQKPISGTDSLVERFSI